MNKQNRNKQNSVSSRSFVATMDSFEEICSFVRDQASLLGQETVLMKIELVAEEAVVNVLSYAYASQDPGKVELSCGLCSGSFFLQIKDWGVPYNPLEQTPDVDVHATAEERRIGGLGLLMLKQMTQTQEYLHEDGANILRLQF